MLDIKLKHAHISKVFVHFLFNACFALITGIFSCQNAKGISFFFFTFFKGLNISVPFGVVSTKKEFLGIFRIEKEKLETHGKKKKKNSTSVTLRALHQRWRACEHRARCHRGLEVLLTFLHVMFFDYYCCCFLF
jgi:hypothetical protein